MTLLAAAAGIVTAIRPMPRLVRAYDEPPEALSEFPCAVVYPSSGELMWGAYHGVYQHTLILCIYEKRTNIKQAVNNAKAWPDLVKDALVVDETLGGVVTGIIWPIRYRAVPMTYGGQDMLFFGVRFEITVKVNVQ